MKKIGLLTISVLAMLGGAAHADQPVPGRWFRLSSTFSSAPCPTGKACLWRKTDHTLHYVDDTGSDIQLGSGGGGGSVSLTCGSGLTCSPSPITGTGSVSPDSTILATLTGTQTLTNKTLSSGSNSVSPLTLKPFSSSWTAPNLADMDAGGNTRIAITQDPIWGDNAHSLQFYGSISALYYKPLIFTNAAYGTTWQFQMGAVGAMLMPGNEIDFVDSGGSAVRAKVTLTGAYALHLGSTSSAPTAAAGACIGGTQTATVSGNDVSGTVTLTGTATGTASSTCATVTFATTWDSAPHCSLSPVSAASSALSGAAQLYTPSSSWTTAHFLITSGATALPSGTYIYEYACLQ